MENCFPIHCKNVMRPSGKAGKADSRFFAKLSVKNNNSVFHYKLYEPAALSD